MTADKVLAELKGVGGTVLRTSFEKSKEDAIRGFGSPKHDMNMTDDGGRAAGRSESPRAARGRTALLASNLVAWPLLSG